MIVSFYTLDYCNCSILDSCKLYRRININMGGSLCHLSLSSLVLSYLCCTDRGLYSFDTQNLSWYRFWFLLVQPKEMPQQTWYFLVGFCLYCFFTLFVFLHIWKILIQIFLLVVLNFFFLYSKFSAPYLSSTSDIHPLDLTLTFYPFSQYFFLYFWLYVYVDKYILIDFLSRSSLSSNFLPDLIS